MFVLSETKDIVEVALHRHAQLGCQAIKSVRMTSTFFVPTDRW